MNNVKYIYARDDKNFPVGCFAYTVKEENNHISLLYYAFSIYYMKDKFNKKRARDVAYGRLEKSPLVLSFATDRGFDVALVDIIKCGHEYLVHPWHQHPKPSPGHIFCSERPGHRFRSACRYTVEKLTNALKNNKPKAA